MKKLILPLLLVASCAIIVAIRPSFLFKTNSFQKTMDRVSEVQRTKECPYDGYTWQEVEIIVDKIVTENMKSQDVDAINHALETGEYGDCKKFLAFDALSEREQKFLIMVCDAPLNKDDESNELILVRPNILCGLLEAAAANALNILSQDAITIRDVCQQKFGLRLYPLMVASSYGIELIDDQKLDQLSVSDSALYMFWYLFFNEASE